MKQTAIFPGRYVQSQGALADLGDEVSRLGAKALAIAGETAKDSIIPPHLTGWNNSRQVSIEPFGGECCDQEISRLAQIVKEQSCDVVIGVGGGKVIDTAKAVGHEAGSRAVYIGLARHTMTETALRAILVGTWRA